MNKEEEAAREAAKLAAEEEKLTSEAVTQFEVRLFNQELHFSFPDFIILPSTLYNIVFFNIIFFSFLCCISQFSILLYSSERDNRAAKSV